MKITKITINSIRRLNVNINNSLEELCFGEKINILIGENGSGKSTIIDMIHSLKKMSVISSLPKENPLSRTSPHFKVEFSDGSKISILYHPAPHPTDPLKYVHCDIIKNNKTLFSSNISKFQVDINEDLLKEISLGMDDIIYYKNTSPPEITNPDEAYINELNLINEKLNGYYDRASDDEFTPVNINNIILSNDGLVEAWLKEDVDMPNIIPVSWLPFGWRKYAEITSYIQKLKRGSICLLEEPEIHLHPRLQRLLIDRINTICNENDIQIFISTHSPTLINVDTKDNLSIFHARGGAIRALKHERILLAELGYRPSDIFQSNCIIWVEGPSDRIYIKHWIECIDNRLIEGSDYSFLYYGGKNLSHFDINESESNDFISILKINPNSFIIMDSDFKSSDDQLNDTKLRIISECKKSSIRHWVTDGREIENYLNPLRLKDAISSVHKSFTSHTEEGMWANLMKYKTHDNERLANKVKVAKKYISSVGLNISIEHPSLTPKIENLYNFIISSRYS